jgi:ABC-type branched-subunit amino acid transport system substrate-binding protein
MKQGVNLAVEEINKAGGIKGRKLEPLFEDDASVPAQSVSATEKLINKRRSGLFDRHVQQFDHLGRYEDH